MKKLIEQFIKFGLIGFMNTFINYGIFALLKWLGIYWLIANLTAFFITVSISYLLQTKFVFDGQGQSHGKKLIKSYSVYGFSNGVMENVILGFCISVLGINEYIAKFIPMFFTIPTNFLLHKFWVFKDGLKGKEGKK